MAPWTGWEIFMSAIVALPDAVLKMLEIFWLRE